VLREIAPGITRIIAFSEWNTLNEVSVNEDRCVMDKLEKEHSKK